MAERPILFSGPMVRAILDGMKTQTRRVIRPQPPVGFKWNAGARLFYRVGDALGLMRKCPYGAPGDTLWVRETWSAAAENPRAFPGRHGWRWWDELPKSMRGQSNAHALFYKADGVEVFVSGFSDGVHLVEHWPHLTMEQPRTPPRWRPSIFMPRWASRILLTVTDVRVERLQEIAGEDALAEGVDRTNTSIPGYARQRFAKLWDSINAKRGYEWDSNPWVWVVSFERKEAAHG